MPLYDDVLATIGKTPTVKINRLTQEGSASVYVKLEKFNPGGSVKDRTALGMILSAEREGRLKPGSTIVEPTSGNTGIGLAMIAAVRGYDMVITMPDTMSFERRAMLEFLGAEIILTSGELGMQGSIEMARTLAKKRGYCMMSQFSNPANPKIHEETTAQEIVEDFKESGLDYFVSGVGTGGTISGVGKILKQSFPNIQTVAVEPKNCPAISGGQLGMHGIQGIGAGFVPENYHSGWVDRVMLVSEENAYQTARLAGRHEGVLVGISSGASLWAALHIAKEAKASQRILSLMPDGVEHYMSTPLFLHKKRTS
ncbi:MAG: cysteine synthase A [SAR324 cluster bacterium]|nr:cysteine synthase A [SAR324 cluster bacterium]